MIFHANGMGMIMILISVSIKNVRVHHHQYVKLKKPLVLSIKLEKLVWEEFLVINNNVNGMKILKVVKILHLIVQK